MYYAKDRLNRILSIIKSSKVLPPHNFVMLLDESKGKHEVLETGFSVWKSQEKDHLCQIWKAHYRTFSGLFGSDPYWFWAKYLKYHFSQHVIDVFIALLDQQVTIQEARQGEVSLSERQSTPPHISAAHFRRIPLLNFCCFSFMFTVFIIICTTRNIGLETNTNITYLTCNLHVLEKSLLTWPK